MSACGDQKSGTINVWEKVGSAQLTGLDASLNAFVIGMEDICACPSFSRK